MRDVLLRMIEKSGKKQKSLCIELDIDPAHWSRILKGGAHFPPEKIAKFCELCNSNELAEVIVTQLKCVMVPLTEWERLKEADLRYKHIVEYKRDIQKIA